MEEEMQPTNTRAKFERNTKYEKPEVEDRVVQLRQDGKTWEEITNVIKVDIDEPNMSREMSKTIYNRAISRTITTEVRAGEKFTDHTKALDNMYTESMTGLSRYVNAINKLSEKLDEAVSDGEMDVLKVYGIFIKTAGPMKTIYSEMREFMKMQRDQQDKITLKQEEQVWNEEQMLDYMKKYLDQQEKEGKLRWIKEKIN
jgi:hypothetical protein